MILRQDVVMTALQYRLILNWRYLRVPDACAGDREMFGLNNGALANLTRSANADDVENSILNCNCDDGCHRLHRPTLNGNRLDFQLVLLAVHLDCKNVLFGFLTLEYLN